MLEVLDFVAKPECNMEPLRQTSVVRFGTYEVDLHSGEVRKSGVRIRIQQQPIKLLEVNEATVAAGVMPLHFGPVPASGIPFASVIVEVTPIEFEKIKADELKLPDGWVLGQELPKRET